MSNSSEVSGKGMEENHGTFSHLFPPPLSLSVCSYLSVLMQSVMAHRRSALPGSGVSGQEEH